HCMSCPVSPVTILLSHTYSLSLHDALPISFFLSLAIISILLIGSQPRNVAPLGKLVQQGDKVFHQGQFFLCTGLPAQAQRDEQLDRKSTRLNSSHVSTSYAVFCLKKKRDIS